MKYKIIAWNVNSIKTLIEKQNDLFDLIKTVNPTIMCFGETKVTCPFDDLENKLKEKIRGYEYRYWSPCQTRKGYSGTAIFSKKKPISVHYGLHDDFDKEGRVITLEFEDFNLIHVYTPNSGAELKRLEYRVDEWDKHFRNYIKKLSKPVIVCGDLNVAHHEIDLHNPSGNLRSAGFTVEERKSFTKTLKKLDLVDTFRHFHPDEVKYSYWSYRGRARKNNKGWRIDYFLVSNKILNNVKKSLILNEYNGSDHCPVYLDISF